MVSRLPTQKLRALRGHSGAINAIRFTADGKYCLTAGDDRSVRLWNPFRDDVSQEGQALQIQMYSDAHGHPVLDVCPTTDNTKFAAVGGDRTAFLWDIATSRVLRRFQGHPQRINATDFNDECTVLFTASYDKTVRCWDCRSHNRDPIQVLTEFKDSVTSLSHTESKIIASSVDGTVRTFDLRMADVHTDEVYAPVTCVNLTYDHKCILASCLGGVIRLLEMDSGEQLNQFTGHAHASYKLESVVANTDAHVISGSEDGRIVIWDLVDAVVVRELQAHDRNVSSLAYHKSEAFMLSASFDGTAYCWGA